MTGGVFGPPQSVVCVTDFPPHIQSTPRGIEVEAAGKRITFAAAAEHPIRLLLSGDPLALAEVAAATGVDTSTLADTLSNMAIAGAGHWGMCPFAGSTSQDEWRATDLAAFMASGRRCSTIEAAFRLAFDLPRVSRIAVGTTDPTHLEQLIAATEFATEPDAIGRYRELIRARCGVRPITTGSSAIASTESR